MASTTSPMVPPQEVPDGRTICGILYDIYCPSPQNGGLQSNIPLNHPHAGHSNDYYYRRITNRLRQLGYENVEYSAFSKDTTPALAITDACSLQSDPECTWMAVPGVMRRMHVIEFKHLGSLY